MKDHAPQFQQPSKPHTRPPAFQRTASRKPEPMATDTGHINLRNALAFVVMLLGFVIVFLTMTR